MDNKKIYFVHDNGGRPFKVTILNGVVNVYKMKYYNENAKKEFYNRSPLFTFYPQLIFIGRSPSIDMTRFSGGFGPEFDGNSLLLYTGKDQYIFIGNLIYSFTTKNKIIKYISPVGSNDVPYPYAVDDRGNIYLMIENAVIKMNEKIRKQMKDYDDPYSYYYDYGLITTDYGIIPPRQPLTTIYDWIKTYYIDKESYTLIFSISPEENYERLTSKGEKMYVIDKNKKKTLLTKKLYVRLMKNYGLDQSFEKMENIIILQNRSY